MGKIIKTEIMKILVITIILLFNLNILHSQESEIVPLYQLGEFVPDDNSYYYFKDINGDLNKFLGTWNYQDSTSDLNVTFYLKLHEEAGGDFKDKIFARFSYVENGITIYNTYNDTSIMSELYISGCSLDSNDRAKMSIVYSEPDEFPYPKGMTPKLKIEFIPCTGMGCSPQLKWDIVWFKNDPSDIWPFKMPTDITLTRQ